MLEEALFRNDLHVGDVLFYPIYGGSESPLKVKIVGAFMPLDQTDPYWYQGLRRRDEHALHQRETPSPDDLLGDGRCRFRTASWYYAFDLREIKTSQLPPLTRHAEPARHRAVQAAEGHARGDLVRRTC